MDINKVQKMNDMAVNLQKHNIVFSQDEAIAQAQNIYGKQFSQESEEEDNLKEIKKEIRKFGFALQYAINDIKELKSQVGKLKRELNDTRVNQTPKRAERPVQSTFEPKKILQPEQKIANPIDRNGIAPVDVSIEKFFYYGEK